MTVLPFLKEIACYGIVYVPHIGTLIVKLDRANNLYVLFLLFKHLFIFLYECVHVCV